MATWTLIQTNAGLELQAKLIAKSEALSFTKVVTSPDIVNTEELKEQTEVNNVKQNITINGLDSKENSFTIHSLLKNDGLEEGYSLNQLGFYATDPDGGEVLYAIAQIDKPKEIPKETDSPGFGIIFSFTFATDTTMDVTVIVNPDGLMTYEAVEAIINEREKAITAEIDEIIELADDITEE